MTAFISICALLVAVAVALLVWPLLKPAPTEGEAPARAGIAATIIAAILPLAAFATYFSSSQWPWDAVPAHEQAGGAVDLNRMAAQLQQRLSQQPDDVDGWQLLGRSAAVLGNYALARDAFAQAYTRSGGQDAEVVAGYAEALVLNDERELDGRAAELFEQALAMAPDNARALWYGGIVAYRRGDLELAERRWVELQNQELPVELRQMVAEQLSEVATARGVAPPVAVGGNVSAQSVAVLVTIAPALVEQAPSQATLFVIARRGDAGPPLAVVRRAVGPWPAAITITDADAMLPGVSLASGGALRVIARISRSGRPTQANGDLYGEVSYDFSANGPVKLVIDRIVP